MRGAGPQAEREQGRERAEGSEGGWRELAKGSGVVAAAGDGAAARTGRGLDLDRGEGERERRWRGGERSGRGLLGFALGC